MNYIIKNHIKIVLAMVPLIIVISNIFPVCLDIQHKRRSILRQVHKDQT